LVVAGGFDERVANCVHTLRYLQRICDDNELSHSTDTQTSQILFLTNISEKQKLALLKSEHTRALLYTPSFEHLGIVPLEAMACGLPVLAVNNGGPQETIIDGETGLLRPALVDEWAEAITILMNLQPEEREKMSKAGQQRIKDYFDVKVLARAFEKAAREVVELGETGQVPDIWTEASTLKFAMFVSLSTMCACCLAGVIALHTGYLGQL
jgi:alpha-1,3/alpha-1,6-mannosyltransferase